MKISVLKRIAKDDLAAAGEIPKWLDALLLPLNQFIENVGRAVQGQLTLTDNFARKIVSQSFTSGVTYEINPLAGSSITGRTVAIIPGYLGGKTLTGLQWDFKSSGNINVTLTFAGGGTATCNLFLLLE